MRPCGAASRRGPVQKYLGCPRRARDEGAEGARRAQAGQQGHGEDEARRWTRSTPRTRGDERGETLGWNETARLRGGEREKIKGERANDRGRREDGTRRGQRPREERPNLVVSLII